MAVRGHSSLAYTQSDTCDVTGSAMPAIAGGGST